MGISFLKPFEALRGGRAGPACCVTLVADLFYRRLEIGCGYASVVMKLSSSMLLALGCLWVGCAVARARIGETEKECEERYGKGAPVQTDKSCKSYRKPPFRLVLHFTEGKCDEIYYLKTEEITPGARSDFSEDERDMLRKANGGAREWKKSAISSEATTCYETTDGELGSIYATATRMLIILTREAHKRYGDQVKAVEENLKGF